MRFTQSNHKWQKMGNFNYTCNLQELQNGSKDMLCIQKECNQTNDIKRLWQIKIVQEMIYENKHAVNCISKFAS